MFPQRMGRRWSWTRRSCRSRTSWQKSIDTLVSSNDKLISLEIEWSTLIAALLPDGGITRNYAGGEARTKGLVVGVVAYHASRPGHLAWEYDTGLRTSIMTLYRFTMPHLNLHVVAGLMLQRYYYPLIIGANHDRKNRRYFGFESPWCVMRRKEGSSTFFNIRSSCQSKFIGFLVLDLHYEDLMWYAG